MKPPFLLKTLTIFVLLFHSNFASAQIPFKISVGPQLALTWSKGTYQPVNNTPLHYIQKNVWNGFPFGAWGICGQVEVVERYRLTLSWLNTGVYSGEIVLYDSLDVFSRVEFGFQAKNLYNIGLAYKLAGIKAPIKHINDWGLDFWLGVGVNIATTPRHILNLRQISGVSMRNNYLIKQTVKSVEKTNTSLVLDFSTQLTYKQHKMVIVGIRYGYTFTPSMTSEAQIGHINDTRIDNITMEAGRQLLNLYINYPIKVYSNAKRLKAK